MAPPSKIYGDLWRTPVRNLLLPKQIVLEKALAYSCWEPNMGETKINEREAGNGPFINRKNVIILLTMANQTL